MTGSAKDAGALSGSREPDPTSGSGPPGFDPARIAWLHIRGQFTYHSEAYIVGSRAGLLALQSAIIEALDRREGEAIAYANDGEGYAVTVRLTSRLRDMGSPPYIDQLARDGADFEREWMRKTQRHNFDLYAKLKHENAIAMEEAAAGETACGLDPKGDSAGRKVSLDRRSPGETP